MLTVRAPGRVNLIGEHTDYNDGFVLPVAINRAIRLYAQPRTDTRCVVYSEVLDDQIEFDLSNIPDPESLGSSWARYVVGVSAMLTRHTARTLTGVEAVLASDLPSGAGLSSSAALESAFAVLWNHLDTLGLDRKTLALLCQQAEWHYAGVHCGIMDQFASLLSESGCALFVDTRSLETESVPLPKEWVIVVADTGKPRALADSAYNERRAHCEAAVQSFRSLLGNSVSALRDVSAEEASMLLPLIPEPLRRRARHVVSENARVRAFLQALREANPQQVRHLMLASHASLRDDYEVSCAELDLMVSACLQSPGCVGVRMTGAGFGGACVALVERTHLQAFLETAQTHYRQQSHFVPNLFACEAVGGTELVAGE